VAVLVDGNARHGLTSNGANVDNVALAALGPLQEDGEDGLGHVDEAGDVGLEDDVGVVLFDVGGAGDALDEAAL
jgi:hypothetical protein